MSENSKTKKKKKKKLNAAHWSIFMQGDFILGVLHESN